MGGGRLRISSDGVIEGFFVGLKFSIPGFFWLVFHLRGYFFASSKQSEVVILMLLMKQFFFWGGGFDFCCHSIIPSLNIPPHPPLRTGCQKKESLRLK